MKKLLYFVCLCCMLVSLCTCDKKKEEDPVLCTLYGTVTDKATGDPVRSAGVELLPIGRKAVTGNDGSFEFTKIDESVYKLFITKIGYKDFTTNDIVVKATSKQPHNIQIEKLPPALTIVDDNRNEIDSIDFGIDEGITMRSFNIFNNSEDKLEWSIAYQCDWIKINKIEGELKANATQSLVITIDRLKLNLGDNSTLINIVSNNGSKQLTITASCNSVIETKNASDIGGISAVLNANVVRDLNPSITEYGFVYSLSPAPRLTNDAKKLSQTGTPKIGTYSMLLKGLENNTQYFSCAFVSNAVDTIYGEQIDFTTTSHIPAVNIESTQEKATSVTVIYKVISDGGLSLEEVGICWSTNPIPTIEDNYKKAGNEAKQYTTKIAELTPNKIYYIRAYVRNAESESYSPQVVIMTKDGLAKVTTAKVTNIGSIKATCGGDVTDDGSMTVTARGVCYGTSQEPTIENLHTTDGSGTGEFISNLKNLQDKTTYYVRAYATTEFGTTYGEERTFKTTNGTPIVELTNVGTPTANSVVCKGNVTGDGGVSVTERGFCYSLTQYPTNTSDHIAIGSGIGDFTGTLTGLALNSKYYIRAYAVNSLGIGYSEQQSFTTKDGLATVTTATPTSTATTISTGGNVSDNGGFAVTERGVCYSSTNSEPTKVDGTVISGKGNGSFSATITGLNAATTYYIRAYATNENGTSYGNVVTVITKNGSAAVAIGDITNITALTATANVTVTDAGGATLQSCGICWSTNPNPTVADSKAAASGKQLNTAYACNMSELQPNTTYYVRGYATTDVATAYSSQMTFKTKTGLPVVTTGTATSTASSITATGEVTENGGYSVTARGFCYSKTNSEPTMTDKNITSGSGNGTFSASINSLDASSTYYVRAYATNSIGTSYGNTITVTTKNGVATISIGSITNITALTATANVTVTDAGGSTIQSCGICWSTNPNPTVADSKAAASGKQLNTAYACNMSGLNPNTSYYVRGYALTDVATAYSPAKTFSTKDGLPIVSTTATTATSTNITTGGNISSDGGYAITARGVCYSTKNSNPTIADNYITAGMGTGTFSANITDVAVNTTYYVRAYASNSIGTSYGDVATVTTGNGLPSVTTTVIGDNVTSNSAVGGGNVTDDGGYAITVRGVCWSTLPSPTVYDNKTTNGSGKGYFTSNITGIDLTGDNVYYVRAYATNINGTVYGNAVKISKENLDYAQLPTFQYGGYTYKLYDDIGIMNIDAAHAACEGLTYGGYYDWFLPSIEEMQAAFNAIKEGWKVDEYTIYSNYIERWGKYWTSSESSSYYYYVTVTVYHYSNGNTYNFSQSPTSGSSNVTYRVRPVRKYIVNQ